MSVADTMSDAVARVDEYLRAGEYDESRLDEILRVRSEMDGLRVALDRDSLSGILGILRVTDGATVHEIVGELDRCPRCGHDDVAAWADDGESDRADWWECLSDTCTASGAILAETGSLTQNGLEVFELEGST